MIMLLLKAFFQLLKRERIKRRIYSTRSEARQDVFDYIEMFITQLGNMVTLITCLQSTLKNSS